MRHFMRLSINFIKNSIKYETNSNIYYIMETLQQGNSNKKKSMELQYLLYLLGFNIVIDGDFGPGTKAFVIQFQKNNNLSQTGICDINTWNMLYNIINSKYNKTSISLIIKLLGEIPVNVIKELYSVMEKYKINNALRLSHFLAQASHESANFTAVRENLNYSADGLKSIFGKYFPGDLANSYARNPQKIANKVYANRMGNGDEKSNTGWLYRGAGFIQLTGKQNFTEFNKVVEEDLLANPDLVASKYPLLSAGFFWDKTGLNTNADKGSSEEIIKEITKKVNGGLNGISDRISKHAKFYKLLK